MAKKGDQARETVKGRIIEAFGKDFVSFQDKKIYVQAQDGQGGEILQFAITITMPKTPVTPAITSDVFPKGAQTETVKTVIEMTPEDQAKVKELMKNLGIE